MEKQFFITVLLGVIILLIIRYFRIYKSRETNELKYNDMENQFYLKINNGHRPYKLLDIYTPMDLMIIESLFLSEGIPYHCDFRHIMSIRPFLPIINYTNCNFYILEEDYSDALIIIFDYIGTKRLKNYGIRIRNIFEIVIGGWIVYNPQEILGITVYKKENKNKRYKNRKRAKETDHKKI